MKSIRFTRGRLFTLLLLASGVLSLLPGSCTGWMRSPFQVLALPQWGALLSAQRIREGAAVTAGWTDRLGELQAENEQLRVCLAQQRLWLADLERRYDSLCGLRGQIWSDRVNLVVARVVGFDASPWHETVWIGRGADYNLKVGQWVAGGPGLDGWENGAEFLQQHHIVGRVSEVQTHVSRVELATDPRFREPAVAVKVLADGTWSPDESRRFVISGMGRGRMTVREAEADLCKLGFTYMAIPSGHGLPMTLSIGRIRSSPPSPLSSLHYDIEVETLVDPAQMRYVAVIVVPQ